MEDIRTFVLKKKEEKKKKEARLLASFLGKSELYTYG
jgi:hypothetical protein